jgi:ferredoxin
MSKRSVKKARRRPQALPVLPAAPAPAAGPKNLLDFQPVAAIARSRYFPAAFQWVTASVFAIIVWQLLLGPRSAHDNAGTALVWVLWWPLLPLLFIGMGRFWCAVCPFGWLSDQVQKLVGVHQKFPRLLKTYGIWIIDALFILITWSDHVWGVVESPWGSGVLLLVMTSGVIVSGALFERRTFCRYVCFLGGVAGNYSRTGMVQLRADTDICATCKSKAACFNGSGAAAPCPLFEFPRQMDESANCVLCANCIKNCPNDAISVTLRPPTKELWFIRKPKLEAAFLAVAIMGIVFIQNVTMLGFWADVTSAVASIVGTDAPAVVYTIVFAAAIGSTVGLLYLASLVAGRVNGVDAWKNFARFGYALIPLDVAGHVAHNLFHLLAEGGNVLTTTLALAGIHGADRSPALASNQTIQILQYALLALGSAGSLHTAWRIADRKQITGGRTVAQWAPYALLITAFLAINVVLFAIPMAHRM